MAPKIAQTGTGGASPHPDLTQSHNLMVGFQTETDVSADTDTDKGSDRLSLPTDIRNRGCHGKL